MNVESVSALPEMSAYYEYLWNSKFTELMGASSEAKPEETEKFLAEQRT